MMCLKFYIMDYFCIVEENMKVAHGCLHTWFIPQIIYSRSEGLVQSLFKTLQKLPVVSVASS